MTSNETKCKKAQQKKRTVRELEKLWITSAEAREYLDCSDEYLSKLRDEARISFARIGGRYYHEVASIVRMFEFNKTAAVTPRVSNH